MRGIAWMGSSYALGQGVSLATTVFLARVLVPADFGVVAIANLMLALVGPFYDSGLSAAFVARRGAVRAYAATLAWSTPVSGALAWGAVVLAAPLVGWAFATPAVVPVMRVLGAGLVLRGIAAAPLAILSKELAFRSRSGAVVTGIVVEAAVSIALAASGHGLWALVGGQLAGAAAVAVMAWTIVPWRPRARFSRARLRRLWRYGRHMTAGNLLGFLGSYLDNILVGRLLGAGALGLYGAAFRWGRLPGLALGAVLGPVAFPTYVLVRDDPARLRAGYLRLVRALATVSIPAGVGLAVVAPALVRALYGPAWEGMIAPLQVFAFFGIVNSVVGTTGEVFKALDRPGWIPGLAAVHLPALSVLLWLLAPRGPAWAALALTLAAVLSGSVALGGALRLLGLGPRALLAALATPLAAAAVMATAALAVGRALAGAAAPIELALVSLSGALAYVGALAVLDRPRLVELTSAVRTFSGRSPAVTA
jgi:PST family polysaccharide transporter